jgi:magnesium-transporting ATPase (P-type)
VIDAQRDSSSDATTVLDRNAHILWHSLPPAEAFGQVGSSPDGLSAAEAAARLLRHGPNRLPPAKRHGPLVRFLLQFHNLLIYVLLGAALVTALLGHVLDTGVIVGVVLINAVVGFVQEGKAERALEAVRGMLSPQAVVLRDGARLTIDAADVVPGDVVLLQSGDRVPADLRLFRVRDLEIDEAVLTGESMPVDKTTAPVPAAAVVGDRAGMAFSGTLVTYGQASGVVVATGPRTELGRIGTLLATVEAIDTPLIRKLAGFARWLTGVILAGAAATFVFGWLFRDLPIEEVFLAAVGLAVAAIPEGLPAIVTITLAVGVQRMAGRNAIIRRLPAVEALGAVTVICSDKTGTLTRNEMTAVTLALSECTLVVGGAGYDPHGGFRRGEQEIGPADVPDLLDLCRGALLCNDAVVRREGARWTFDGDPTELALAILALKAGLDPHREAEAFPRRDVIPFEAQHRLMATLHHDHARHAFVWVKGAPETVLPRCSRERAGGLDRPLDPQAWEERVQAIAANGERPLALAFGAVESGRQDLAFGDIAAGLTLLGAVGLADPPRAEAAQSVRACQSAGIAVKLITGDHAATAAAVAGRLGIDDGRRVLVGADLEQLSDAGLREVVGEVHVYARTSPEHKLRLVEALQARGAIVAMTGDGVNDAPALKRADVGVAMGRKGTEAAKEAAAMVLADDNFASIAAAVEEGRTIDDNIQKSILFILPTSFGEALAIVAAVLFGVDLPVSPAQILWVNMVTTVTLALSLSFEPAEAGVMRRPPKDPAAPMLTGFMLWRMAFVSMLMLAGVFGLFMLARAQGADLATARTVAVNTLVVIEALYLFNTRYFQASVLCARGLLGNRWVLIAVALVMLLQLGFTYAGPLQLFFESRPVGLPDWAGIGAVGLAVLLLVEAEKALLRSRTRQDPATTGR